VVGLNFGRYHVRTFSAMDEYRLVGVADRLAPDLDEYAERHGATPYRDGFEMMEQGALDAVSLCVPPGAREPLLRHAIAKGIPVIVEKPWAADMEQALRLAELCRAQQAVVMVAFSFRFLPPIVRLRELLDGELGPGWLLNGEYVFGWLPPAGHWLWNPAEGNGLFNENSGHLFDGVCYLLGRPVSLSAQAATFTGSPSEDACALTLRFESGAIAALTCGALGAGAFRDYPRVDLKTQNGEARLMGRDHMWETLSWATRTDDRVHTFSRDPVTEHYSRYSFAMRHFAQCLREGLPPSVGVAEGVRAVEMAMAVYESARTGRSVELMT
jgi:predicted dehydrogenase